MSYLVLARKYRPQRFSEVVGQEHVTKTMANAFAKDRVHHAFLLCGPRGVGKTTLARLLGKALNCERGTSAEPCNECSACTTITDGSAMDYYEMDGASNRGIDAVRELTEAVRYQPAVLRKKVYVIDEVHMLTTEAFNALLKTLEEPPPHITFIMATTEPHKLPVTVLSRCQRYDFKLVGQRVLIEHLESIFAKESITIETGALIAIARESGGSVRDALSLSDQVISYVGSESITEVQVAEVLGVADRALTRSLLVAILERRAEEVLHSAQAAVARGVNEMQLARALVRTLRDLAAVKLSTNSAGEELVDGDAAYSEDLRGIGADISHEHIARVFDRLMRACSELGEAAEPKLVLEFALIEVATLPPLVPLDALVNRLIALESKLGGPAESGGGSSGGADGSDRQTSSTAGTSPQPATTAAATQTKTETPDAQVAGAAKTETTTVTAAAPEHGTAQPDVTVDAPTVTPTADAGAPPLDSSELPTPSTAAAVVETHDATQPAQPASTQPLDDDDYDETNHLATRSAQPSLRREQLPDDIDEAFVIPDRIAGMAVDSVQPAQPAMQPDPTASANAPAAGQPIPSATPATPTAISTTGTVQIPEAARQWERAITALGDDSMNLPLVRIYENAKIISWDKSRVEVGYPRDALDADIATAPDKVQRMQDFLCKHAGAKIELFIKLLDGRDIDSAKSLLELQHERTQQDRVARETEARKHPLTYVVLETFGADIQEVKTNV